MTGKPNLARELQAAFAQAARHRQQGELAPAAQLLGEILKAHPDHADSLAELGLIAQQQGQLPEAVRLTGRAAALAPGRAEVHARLGSVLMTAGRGDEAVAAFRRAVELKPGSAIEHVQLGTALQARGAFAEALAAADGAIARQAKLPEAHNLRGAALQRLGRADEAIAAYRRAVKLRPRFAEAHNNLGMALRDRGLMQEAAIALRRAVAEKPQVADFRCNLALCLLALGNLAEGWEAYEARRGARSIAAPPRALPQPLWNGAAIAGTLLLHGEQGIGDEIFFAGLASDAARQARHIVLECAPRLVPIFARSFSAIEVIARLDPPHARISDPTFVAQSPTGSLPRLFRRRFEDFAPQAGYLRAEPAPVAALRDRYRRFGDGPLVGISWSSRNAELGPARTVALERWAPILAVPGVVFVSVQYGDCAAELAEIQRRLGVTPRHDPEIDPLTDMDGFAAQLAALDLVISIDNSTAHLAGALGRPAWTMVPKGRGLMWYWFLDRDDSPWYPTMRLFRQATPGRWEPVIERVAEELRRFVAQPR